MRLNRLTAAVEHYGKALELDKKCVLAASREALVLAERKGKLELTESIRQRMELYTAQKPYRHVPRPTP